jgi:hypothetical protein
MSQGLKMRHAIAASVLGVLLLFQNCSQVDQGAANSASSSSTFEQGLPFAYDAKLDTISYMSCSQMADQANSIEKRAYYTFRAGAYNNQTGGLAMTDEFRQATRFYKPADRARLFSSSDKNASTRLSLSVRQVGNYQAPWKEGEFRIGEEVESFLPALDSAAVAGPLAASQPGQMIQYFPGTHSQRLLEASLRFYNYENTAKLTRDTIDSRAALLVAGYQNSSSEMDQALRAPVAGAADKVYGTGYYMRFSLPVGYSSGERRVISASGGIEELDLATNTVKSANWDCAQNYQFMVIRPEDKAAGRVLCDAIVDRYDNATEQAALNAIRRVLRVEDWFVDIKKKCIMPKRTGDFCYGPLNGRTVQYGVASCLNGSTTMCPHFVSVCIKR